MDAYAAVLTAPRTFEMREFPLPQTGADDGVLRIEACGLCGTDYDQWLGEFFVFGSGMPLIPGHEIIGHVESIGSNASARWGVTTDDRVALEGIIPCGTCPPCLAGNYKRCTGSLGYGLKVKVTEPPGLWGGYATHAYLHPRAIVHRLPPDVPTAVMALQNPLSNGVRWVCETGGAGVGSRVVICGPGQRGLMAVFAAREAGAAQIIVTGTSKDRYRLDVARELGATTTIDVDTDDPVAVVKDVTGGKLADLVLDVSSHATEPVAQAVDMVRAGGRIVLAGLKSGKPVANFVSDKIVLKEIQVVGVFSAGWTAVETAIALIAKNAPELSRLATHSFAIGEAQKAMQVLGREIVDGPELLNIHLRAER